MAAFEIGGLFCAIAVATLVYLLGWLTPEQAGVLTLFLLLTLDVLAWKRFDQGRHPCFLFLCVLTLLQGGRFIAYLAGIDPDPMRIGSMSAFPFDISRTEAGTVLLSLAISAVCIYAPCRWSYRRIPPPPDARVRKYLPYLYLVFYCTLPLQLFKSYRYYQYIKENGGYLQFWISHGDVASSVPFLVRAVVLFSFPVFVAIFVFERKKKWLYLTTALYFGSTVFTLLMGLRGGLFALVLVLWYVAAIKSTMRSRLLAIAALAFMLVVIGDVVQVLRGDTETTLSDYTFAPVEFVKLQGNSLEVTWAAIRYRHELAPHALSYLWNDLQDAFVPRDVQDYAVGRKFAYDVSVLMNPVAFGRGRGTAGSYIGHLYLIGGLAGVAVGSLLLGCGLHSMHSLSRNPLSLFMVAAVMPDVLLMPRGQLLDWASVLLKTAISVAILWLGWQAYELLAWLGVAPRARAVE
jgi:hypothetical protein